MQKISDKLEEILRLIREEQKKMLTSNSNPVTTAQNIIAAEEIYNAVYGATVLVGNKFDL